MKPLTVLLAISSVWHHAAAIPTPTNDTPTPIVEERQLLSGLGNLVGGTLDIVVDDVVLGLVKSLLLQVHNALAVGDRHGVLDAVEKLVPTATPRNVEAASDVVKALSNTKSQNIVEYSANLIANGIIKGNVGDILEFAKGLGTGENSQNNANPEPPKAVFPKVESADAPYSVSEDKLRAAIHIPDTFTHGEKQPVILFPGTGNTGYITFAGNFIPLLQNSDWADPVWVNVPGYLLDDAQVNAEYAAYALNYIASLTKRNVAVIAWSQGNIDVQWALKYWPSTRKVTNDHVAVSADYKGTTLANLGSTLGVVNDPSVLQQRAGSNFIKALRADGGDSGYIPTTSIYSGFYDEVVQPQSGTDASAYLLDARGVGVTNTEVQVACAGQPAGTFYTHESLLANPLTFALAKDAILNKGPGELSRVKNNDVCGTFLTSGLGLDEYLVTENALLVAALGLVVHLPKVSEEPPLKAYVSQ